MSKVSSAISRNSQSDLLAKLQKQVADAKKAGGGNKDDRFWQPTVDASGSGSAVLRFLPSKNDDILPYVKTYRHTFQEGNSWFIEECPQTVGKDCPVCESNSQLWATKLDADIEVARKRGRKTEYIANVLIVKDPGNKENEGQVRLYRFGKKIFEKIEDSLSPDPESGEEARNVFGFFDGANFNLRISKVANFRNYDKSKFVPAADLYDGDEDKLVELLDKTHDLSEFVDPANIKSYEDLKTRFLKVTGQLGGRVGSTVSVSDNTFDDDVPNHNVSEVGSTGSTAKPGNSTSDSTDADIEFLQSLADDIPF